MCPCDNQNAHFIGCLRAAKSSDGTIAVGKTTKNLRLTVKVSESVFFVEGARAKVDQLEFACLEVDQQVLVLDVSVDDPPPVASQDRLDHLPEEASRQLLFENSFLCDEVEEVLPRGRSLHDKYEGVRSLKEVEEFDHSVNILDAVQQLQLKRNSPTVQLQQQNVTFLIR